MRIHYFQHVDFEDIAMIGDWARDRGHTLTKTAFYEEQPKLPNPDDFDALVIMGGPMNIYEEDIYSWFVDEKAMIRQAIDSGKHVLGVCLGGQLIADTLGGETKANTYKEIGWHPVEVVEGAQNHPILAGIPQSLTFLHWHAERFEIPQGATLLFRSEGCAHQGFVYKERVLGLQCHLEIDTKALKPLIKNCGHEITEGKFVQEPDELLAHAETSVTKDHLYTLLDNWSAQ